MQRGVKRAASLVLAAGAALLCGCDQDQRRADRQIALELTEASNIRLAGMSGADAAATAKLESAVSHADASAYMKAAAKAALAQAQLTAATAKLDQIDKAEMDLSRVAWEITQLATQVRTSNSAVAGYQKYDPQPVRDAIAAKIAEAQGGPDKPAWFTHGNSTIPTLSAVKQDIAKIEGEIAQLQEQVKTLADHRSRLLNDAEEAAAQAERTKGQEAVEVFRKSSDLRRQAGEKQIEIDKLRVEIDRQQRLLGIAQGQQATLNEVISQLQDQANTMEASWKEVDAQIARQRELARQILGTSVASSAAAEDEIVISTGNTISEKAAVLDRIVNQIEALRAEAEPLLRDAAKYFGDAKDDAEAARIELEELIREPNNAGRPEIAAWRNMLKTIDSRQFRLQQARAERVRGGFYSSQAASLSNRITLRDTVTAALQGTGLQVPAPIQNGDLAKARNAAVEEADVAFKASEDLLTNIIESSSGDPIASQALLSRALTYYGWAQLERLDSSEQRQKSAENHIALAIKDRDLAAGHELAIPAMPVEFGPNPKPAAVQPTEEAPAEPEAGATETPAAPAEGENPQPEAAQ